MPAKAGIHAFPSPTPSAGSGSKQALLFLKKKKQKNFIYCGPRLGIRQRSIAFTTPKAYFSLALAEVLFAGPYTSMTDDRFEYGEVRQVAFGFINGRFFVCVYTDRNAERRVISLRKQTKETCNAMPTNLSKAARDALAGTDWRKIHAMTDEDIAKQIAANPDAAPDMAPEMDVRAIRRAAGMTQAQFAEAYEFSIRTLQEWERGAKKPSGPARTLLRAIKADPDSLRKALAAE